MWHPTQLVLHDLEGAEYELLGFLVILRLKLFLEDGCDSVEIGLL